MRTCERTEGREPASAAGFSETHWSVVLRAQEEASLAGAAALDQLCRTYWYPLYAYVRRCGESPADAQDLTQAFFARFLEKGWLRAANRDRGRFRWFLLASLKHFLANQWDRARAQKRGGGRRPISLDELAPEERYALEPADHWTPDRVYDRAWALTLLKQARLRVRAEYSAAGRTARFELIEQFLPGEQSTATYAEVAEALGVAEGTVKSDVSRLRQRYGVVLREELGQTLGSETELEDELRYLCGALG